MTTTHLHLLRLAGCVVIGLCLARLILRTLLALIGGAGLFTVLAAMIDKEGNNTRDILTLLVNVLFAALKSIANMVGLEGVVGLAIGVMFGLYRMKIESERRKGIVRFPYYPSPE